MASNTIPSPASETVAPGKSDFSQKNNASPARRSTSTQRWKVVALAVSSTVAAYTLYQYVKDDELGIYSNVAHAEVIASYRTEYVSADQTEQAADKLPEHPKNIE